MRPFARPQLRQAVPSTRQCLARQTHNKARRVFSSSSTVHAADASPPANHLAAFGSLPSELDRIAPRFAIDARDIQILREPKEFYEVLKHKIRHAKTRVYISTLYVGKTEHELIQTLREALTSNPHLKVSLLTDMLRGTREEPHPSCASLLAPLVRDFGPERVRVRMFHTPNLVGFRKAVLPKRINEGWGLQHMKLYGVDDELILSGANLSEDYFTNRQDRYHVFRSKALTAFFERVHEAVSALSFDVRPGAADAEGQGKGFELAWPGDAGCASPLEDKSAYLRRASALIEPLIGPGSAAGFAGAAGASASGAAATTKTQQTWVYPLFQLAPLLPGSGSSSSAPPPSTELPALNLLLERLSTAPFAPARWTFTAGYFNMTPGVRDKLLSSLSSHSPSSFPQSTPPQHQSNPPSSEPRHERTAPTGTILTAHPHANGFFGSSGVSGMLAPAYTLLASRFLAHARSVLPEGRLALHEWRRGMIGKPGGWTYHAKGLWVWLPRESSSGGDASGGVETTSAAKTGDGRVETTRTDDTADGPALTLVGSSNYTLRSHTLDLEANALILTTDNDLRRRLADEEAHLMAHAGRPVDSATFAQPERKVSWRVRVALWIVGVVGGAL